MLMHWNFPMSPFQLLNTHPTYPVTQPPDTGAPLPKPFTAFCSILPRNQDPDSNQQNLFLTNLLLSLPAAAPRSAWFCFNRTTLVCHVSFASFSPQISGISSSSSSIPSSFQYHLLPFLHTHQYTACWQGLFHVCTGNHHSCTGTWCAHMQENLFLHVMPFTEFRFCYDRWGLLSQQHLPMHPLH